MVDGGGVKNLWNLSDTGFTKYDTTKGIVYRNNEDSTFYVTGTSTQSDVYVNVKEYIDELPFGLQIGDTVVVMSDHSDVQCCVIPRLSSGSYGSTVRGTLNNPGFYTIASNCTGLLLRMTVPTSGTTVDANVSGMLCKKDAWDVSHTFIPYTADSSTLSKSGLMVSSMVDRIGKNMLWFDYRTTVDHGVTFTVNDDKSITCSGTINNSTSGYATIDLYNGSIDNCPYISGKMLSGCPNIENYQITIELNKSPYTVYAHDNGQYGGARIKDIPAGTGIHFFCRVNGHGTTVSGTFKPMICTPDQFKLSDKYVPYMGSVETLYNRQQYEVVTLNTSVSSLLHIAALAQRVDDKRVGGVMALVTITTDTNIEYLMGISHYKYGSFMTFNTIVKNNIAEGAKSAYGTFGWSGGTGPYYVRVRFI
jgi:hypothetical protein